MTEAADTNKEEEVRNEELSAVAEQEKPPTERELRIAAFLARDEEQEAELNREHRLNILTKIRGRLDPELQQAAAAVEKERMQLQDRKLKPWSDVNSLLLKKQSCVSGGASVAVRATRPTHSNQRGLLRAQLRSKTIQTSTRWLAKELGYKDEAQYLHNLKVSEITRKEASIKQRQMQRQREAQFSPPSSPSHNDSASSVGSSPSNPISPQSASPLSSGNESPSARSRLSDHLDDVDVNDTIDTNNAAVGEDLIDIPKEEEKPPEMDLDDNVTEPDEHSEVDDNQPKDAKEVITYGRKSLQPSQTDTEIDTFTQSQDTVADSLPATADERIGFVTADRGLASQDTIATQKTEIDDDTQEIGSDKIEHENIEEGHTEEQTSEPKERAAEYRRMLELDYQSARHTKSRAPAAMLEDEAEEEDEETLKGLGDFGFGLPKSSDKNEDDEAKLTRVTEDDLKNIVDDVSDGEGDDEKGEEFRRAAVESEEREALKRVVERVREGYDKDRTVRGAVRGKFGLNELTAAGNKAEARRLNLLTTDELDSDQEDQDGNKSGAGGADEEEDLEEALTKALVNRHIRQPEQDVFQSDSEDESDAEGGPPAGVEETEEEKNAREEEQRQKLREKLFKLRARMRRVLKKQKPTATTTIGFSTEQTQTSMTAMDEGSQSAIFAEESRTIMNLVDLTNKGTARKSNNMYQGVMDQEHLDAGYGMGMAVSKKHKSHNSTEISSSTSASVPSSTNQGGLFADVTSSTSNQALKRQLTGDMPVLQRQASFATVAKRQCLNRSKSTHSFGGASRNAIAQQFVFMSENTMPGPTDSNPKDVSRDASVARSASTHQRQAKPVTTIGFDQQKPITTIGFDLPPQSQSLLSIALAGKSKSLKRSNTALKPKN